jgi:hypothetical protein
MAQFQTDSNIFAGLMLNYDPKTKKIITQSNQKNKSMDLKQNNWKFKLDNLKKINLQVPLPSKKVSKISENVPNNQTSGMKQAILGGGDIAFPLIFASAVMKETASIYMAMIIVLFATIALTILFFISKPNKFYPAMPYIGTGCLVGLAIVIAILNPCIRMEILKEFMINLASCISLIFF